MITKFEQIVDVNFIGKAENPVAVAELFNYAAQEKFVPSAEDKEKLLLLAVDIQRDFMEGGSLGVKGSLEDVANLTHFIYDNMERITAIAATCDCHSPMQIFHPCWWENEKGEQPEPFTIITRQDLQAERWIPRMMPEKSAEYLETLERQGKRQLCIWPYHCFEASTGGALENQFGNMANFFSAARRAEFRKFTKGRIAYSEFYGAVYPEMREPGTDNIELLNYVLGFDKIIVAGEAMDYCVYETISQLCGELNCYAKKPKVYLLSNCTSSIGDRETAEKQFEKLIKEYGLILI